MRFRPGLLVAGALMLAACSGGGSDSASTTSSSAPASTTPTTPAPVSKLSVPGRENIAFYYQRFRRDSDLSKLGQVNLIVTGKTAARSQALAIKRTGAKAYRGVQAYWFADGDSYDGVEVTERPDWAFCLEGSNPLVARTDAAGNNWYFLDSNERGVREAFAERMRALSQDGWDGVFFDRGFAALTGRDDVANEAWNQVSSCTEDPVQPDATLADAYLGLASEVKQNNLDLIMNYGISPFDAETPMRPDPRDPKCAAAEHEPECTTLDDAWPLVDGVLDEAIAHPRDISWANDYRSNQLNEQNAKDGKFVVGLITQGTMGGTHSREVAYFQWARVKLFVIPLGVNTGDDNCGNPPPGTLCNRQALYPELANIAFGAPLELEPESLKCNSGSKVRCIWIRKYQHGMSLVNVSAKTKATGSIPLGLETCVHVKDVSTQQPLANNDCVKSVSMDVAKWSGHPLVYRETPW